VSGDFYRAFEDRHRGSREAIAQRQGFYLPYLAAVRGNDGDPLLVDLGCGRGEWLELARSAGWRVQGVDANAAMLDAGRAAGLDLRQGDAVEFLATLPDASAGAVTAFHVAEHLPFARLRALVAQSRRVLRPGGLIVLETPNPENLQVGSSAFYMDPTHQRPLPPALLAFVLEHAGFEHVTTVRLHEGIGERPQVELIDVLAGVSPDYAVVAVAPAGAWTNELQELFSRRSGVTLNELAQRYDTQRQLELRELRVPAEMAVEVGVGFVALQHEVRERLQAMDRRLDVAIALEQQAIDRLLRDNLETDVLLRRAEELDRHADALARRVEAMQSSTSWRITAPLRGLGALKRRAAHSVGRALEPYPGLRHSVRSLAVRLKLARPLPPAAPTPEPTVAQPPAAPEPVAVSVPAPQIPPDLPLSARGQRVKEILQEQMRARQASGDR
jgi:SAM-dependent methyltransferase